MSVEHILLDSQTANVAAGAAKQNSGLASSHWSGGERVVCLGGTFDNCTVKLEFAPGSPISGYLSSTDLTFTEPGYHVAWVPGQGTVSASLESAGASTDVSMTIQKPGGKSQ